MDYNKHVFKTSSAFDRWKKQILSDGYAIQGRMGSNSINGSVYSYSRPMGVKSNRYVLKTMPINDQFALAQAIKEAKIGMIPDAPVPVVYAHRMNNATGQYEILMHDVLKDTTMDSKYRSTSMRSYLRSLKQNRVRRTPALEIMHDTLVDFYKRTKHFHGDLHLENVMVVYSKSKMEKISKMFIIDFGSSIKFVNPLPTNIRFLWEFIAPISHTFDTLHERHNFNFRQSTKQWGEVKWMLGGAGVIHNLKQKQDAKYWEWLFLISVSKYNKFIRTLTGRSECFYNGKECMNKQMEFKSYFQHTPTDSLSIKSLLKRFESY